MQACFLSGKKQLKAPPPYKDNVNYKKEIVLSNTGFKREYTLHKHKLNDHDRFLNTPVEPMHLKKLTRAYCAANYRGRGFF